MDKKTQTLIVVGLVAVGGYLWWRNRQEKNGTSSAIGGGLKTAQFCCQSSDGGQWQTTVAVDGNGNPHSFPCGDGGSYCSKGISKPALSRSRRG
jgi:hypothetical protein